MSRLSEADQQRVTIYNHRGAMEGILVMRAHWLVARGFNAKQISEELQKWLVQNETFFVQVISNISFLRAGGRLAALDKGIAKCLLNYAENNKLGIVMGSDLSSICIPHGVDEIPA